MHEAIYKILILISLIINYPVLQQWGIEISKIICVVTSADGRKLLKRYMDLPFITSTDDSVSGNKLTEILSSDSKYIMACYPVIGKSELVKAVLTSVLSSSYEGRAVETLPILICDGMSPLEIDDSYKFHIWIDEVYPYLNNLEAIVLSEMDLSKAKREYEMLSKDFDEEVERAIAAATALLKEYCDNPANDTSYEEVCKVMRTVITQATEYEDMSDFKDIFIQKLFEWTERKEFYFIQKENLVIEDEKNLERIIVGDEEYIYIKEEILKDILKDLESSYPIKVMKDSLRSLGLIKTDKDRYSIKMKCKLSNGETYRTRMTCFINKELVDEMGTSFLEKCISNAKEQINE